MHVCCVKHQFVGPYTSCLKRQVNYGWASPFEAPLNLTNQNIYIYIVDVETNDIKPHKQRQTTSKTTVSERYKTN